MTRSFVCCLFVVTVFTGCESAVEEADPAKRIPWTTGKVTGSPEPPPPYAAPRAFSGAKFHHPLLIARMPGSDLLFVGEQDGKISSVDPKAPDAKPVPFVDGIVSQ